MNNSCDLEGKARLFEKLVISSFDFLESELGMHRGIVRITNKHDPRDLTAKLRFESTSHRFDITWSVGQYGLGIMIWDKSCIEKFTVYHENCYVYFEPFLEFLTNGKEKPIIPQVYPKMSRNRLIKVMDERKKLFDSPLADIIDKLAKKFRANYEIIISKDIVSFTEFHKWMGEQQ